MWIDIDDLRSDIERGKKKLEESDKNLMILGEINGYSKLLKMLDELEEAYMREGRENYKRRMEEQMCGATSKTCQQPDENRKDCESVEYEDDCN